MAQDRTSGYDMLVQISEAEINNQLATAFLAGMLVPSSVNVPVNSSGITGIANLNLRTPVADFDRPRPRMGLTIPFADSQLVTTAPAPLTMGPLAGVIEIVDVVEIITEGDTQTIAIDFTNGVSSITFTFDPAMTAPLDPLLTATGLSITQLQNIMADAVLQGLESAVRRVPLSLPVTVSDDTDPTTVFDLDVTTINDTTAVDRDCLAVGVRMSSEGGGNINNVTSNFIPAGSDSLMMMSNFWLLAKVMRPRVATALGLMLSDFDTPLRLNRNVAAPGGSGTLTRLEAFVENNRIRVNGTATASGTGWSAQSNFKFFLTIGLSSGGLTVTATTPTVDTDVDLEWWVWLVSLGLGALFGGIIGAIIAAIVLAIVEAVAEGIVNNLVATGIGGSLSFTPVPLGPIGGGIGLTSVLLDDLEMRCSIVRSIEVPVKSQGAQSSLTGFALDLDQGTRSNATTSSTDLVWDPSSGISTANGAGLSVTGYYFYSLSPVQVSRMPLNGTLIPLGSIPLTFPPSFPFLPHREVVFGVRTSEGRYAKCRAWRSITEGGALQLQWVTYATPVAQLDIAARWSVLERGDVTEYITSDCYYCRQSPVSWLGVFEAWPRLMAFPVDYQWCLCGQVIKEGEGTVTSNGSDIHYELKGSRLEIKTEMGRGIDCELCVSAIDFRGHELFTCIKLMKPGIDKKCKQCQPGKRNIDTVHLPIQAELLEWRPLLNLAQDVIQKKKQSN